MSVITVLLLIWLVGFALTTLAVFWIDGDDAGQPGWGCTALVVSVFWFVFWPYIVIAQRKREKKLRRFIHDDH